MFTEIANLIKEEKQALERQAIDREEDELPWSYGLFRSIEEDGDISKMRHHQFNDEKYQSFLIKELAYIYFLENPTNIIELDDHVHLEEMAEAVASRVRSINLGRISEVGSKIVEHVVESYQKENKYWERQLQETFTPKETASFRHMLKNIDHYNDITPQQEMIEFLSDNALTH